MRLLYLLAATALVFDSVAAQQSEGHSPGLIFTPQRIKRIKRERERQTPRWSNFEERLRTVPDSPERGFELALYTAVTGEEFHPGESDKWALAHPCEHRQVALIRSVSGQAKSASAPVANPCPSTEAGPIARMRDRLFEHPDSPPDETQFLIALRATPLDDARELYAAAEYLMAAKALHIADPREAASQFFNSLPVQFLLSLKPQQVDRPDWQTHVAALALVALDPNSDSAQFLQGWAIEDRQMLHEGPGVAYELLWADPYLPGVGYQNLDSWWFDPDNARLLARSDWTVNACSIQVTAAGVKDKGCPSGWQERVTTFGRLRLIPLPEGCTQLTPRPSNISAMLWKLPPNSHIRYSDDRKAQTTTVNKAGLWLVPTNVSGKVCSVR